MFTLPISIHIALEVSADIILKKKKKDLSNGNKQNVLHFNMT